MMIVEVVIYLANRTVPMAIGMVLDWEQTV
jgi:hypothetical protein